MKTLKTKLLLSVALSAMLSGTAFAQSNQAYIDQLGSNNTASIDQPGANNVAGTSGNRMVQDGRSGANDPSSNRLTIDQIGDNNSIGASGDGLDQILADQTVGVRTLAYPNEATLTQNSSGNTVGSVRQFVTNNAKITSANSLTVTQGDAMGAGDGNTIDVVSQTVQTGGGANEATVSQTGAGNTIARVSQLSLRDPNGTPDPNTINVSITGDNNGNGTLTGPAAVRRNPNNSGDVLADSTLIQDNPGVSATNNPSYGNDIGLTISGNNNEFAIGQFGYLNNASNVLITNDDNQVGIRQQGDNNTVDPLNVAGAFNNIGVNQLGTFNVASIGAIDGDGNSVDVDQDGTNTTQIDIIGVGSSNNYVDLDQTGTNSAIVGIVGSNNGDGSSLFTGDALSASSGLISGQIIQDGSNTLTFNIEDTRPSGDGSGDGNLFAFTQNGAGNDITGVQNGDNNQAAVTQVGASNMANFSQVGTGNNAGITQ